MQRLYTALLALSILAQVLLPAAAPLPQVITPEERAASLLTRLTPEEKVGQLFLVTFQGAEITEESELVDLIRNYHVGGIVFERGNNNFPVDDVVNNTWTLIQSIQTEEWLNSQAPQVEPVTGTNFNPAFIPLFISISQEGDGPPNDQIINGLSGLPNQMAIGATWKPDLAYQVGQTLGQELSAIGFNLIFGPSLDVLENPSAEREGDLGVRSFGGDPYWVGIMGQAYVEGLHDGSEERLIVIGKHFPGYGSSDRPPEEEIPTIRKSLDQLTQIELAPFFAVTGLAPSATQTVDGLLLSHIRYQGFQGNIRATTRPLSFDPQAFSILMELPQFSDWRAEGGLIISDELGTRAVRRFYDPSEMTFNSRLVARDAFLAGNDLLYLGDFTANDDPDLYTTTVRTLDFFAQKYREDVAFAQRVDDAVLRILTAKFKLYGTFQPTTVLAPQSGLSTVGTNDTVTFDVARQSATLFSPSRADLETVLPVTPILNDKVVFITDTLETSQCAECPLQEALSREAFEQTVLRLYGPETGGQVVQQNLESYTYNDLITLLDDPANAAAMLTDLRGAVWIIFAGLDVDDLRPSSLALQRFLSERPDLLPGKRVIVYSFNAPYYLDATDVSKLTAYYGLYSKQPEFIEIAARILFREVTTPGASPVTINGLGYDLIEATAPNPGQTVPLKVSISGEQVYPSADSVENPPALEGRVGETISVTTGTILDNNSHPVPDNTPVTFVLTTVTETGSSTRELNSTTRNGTAQITFAVELAGILQITGRSGEPSALSESVQFEITGPNNGSVLVVTETPTAEFALPPNIPFVGLPTAAANGETAVTVPHEQTNVSDWFTAILVTAFISLFAYQIGALAGHVRWGVRWSLSAAIGGLAVNTYLSMNLPGAKALILNWGVWGIVIVSGLGALLGWMASWFLQQRGE